MTYSHKYTEARYNQIAGLLTQVQRLEPGGRVRVSGLAPEEQSRVRSLLYDWLHHVGLKARFRVRSEAGRLTVIDLRFKDELTLQVETPLTSKEESEMMGELIQRFEESEAVLLCWLEEGKITEGKRDQLREKLRVVMS